MTDYQRRAALVAAERQQRARWKRLLMVAPSSLWVDIDGDSIDPDSSERRKVCGIIHQDTNLEVAIQEHTCPRYVLFQSTHDENCVYTADTDAELAEEIVRLIEGAGAGEDYGWTLDKVYDLDGPGKVPREVKYDLQAVLRVEYGSEPANPDNYLPKPPPTRRKPGNYGLRSPTGKPITGVIESCMGIAEVQHFEFTEGEWHPEYGGGTEFEYDTQVAVLRNDEILLIDEDGDQWVPSECTAKRLR